MSSFDAKLNFLQSEIQILTEENKELRNLLQLNKEMLRIQRETTNTSSMQNGTLITFENRKSEHIENIQKQSYVSQLIEENDKIYFINENLTKQRDELRAQNLLLQQIGMENSQRILDIQCEKQKKIQDLQTQIQIKDQEIAELNIKLQTITLKKRKQSRQQTNVQVEVLNFQNQLEAMCQILYKLHQENKMLKQENKKMTMVMGMFNQDKKLQQITDQSGDFNDSSIIDFFPDKVNTVQAKQITIPKLNLGRAMKIQKLTVEKMAESEQQQIQTEQILAIEKKIYPLTKAQTPSQSKSGNFISPSKLLIQLTSLTDQNKTLSKELNSCKQNLQNELLLSKTLETKLEELIRYLADLENTNEILIKSIIQQENTIQKLRAIIIKDSREKPIQHRRNFTVQANYKFQNKKKERSQSLD